MAIEIATAEAPSRIEIVRTARGKSELIIEGRVVFLEAAKLWNDLSRRVRSVAPGEEMNFEMSGLSSIDGGTIALLVHLRSDLKLRGIKSEFVGANARIQEIIHLYHGDERPIRKQRRIPESALAQIGRMTMAFLVGAQGVFGFLGDMLLALVGLLKEPRTANWKEVPHTMERTGVDALPIVILINFLVGLSMAYQGAVQLKQFGANIFVAHLVGLGVTREIGPLMTAIIVCGRSGAAFAAELGSMRVSEEIDALRTMGFGPMGYLVLPRVLALMLVVPALTLVGDLVGILGGMTVALLSLDVPISSYLHETQRVVVLWDVSSGLLKSVAYALAIALISCQQGFAASGGAEGVGKRTTQSVVASLFALILIDAGFTVLFHEFRR